MKTILVDAWNTFVTPEWIDQEIRSILDMFENPKIILTNASPEERIQFGIVDMPYEVFSLEHHPNKIDPEYYRVFLDKYHLDSQEVLYFEHNPEAILSAETCGICTYFFDTETRDYDSLRQFLEQNLA